MKKYLFFISIIFVAEEGNAQYNVFSKSKISEPSFFHVVSYGTEKNIFMQSEGGYHTKKIELKKATFQNASKQSLGSKSLFFSKFYVKAYGGYGIFSPGSYRIQSTNNVSYKDQNNNFRDTTIQTQSNRGIGGGSRFGGGIGYVLNDFLNVGVDVEFQQGVKLKNSLDTRLGEYNYNFTYDEMHYKALTLTPHVVFKALAKPGYFIYNKLGILFTLPYTLYTNGNSGDAHGYGWPPGPADTATSSLFVTKKTYEANYKISLGMGFNVAFGLNMRLNNKFRIFGELFGNFSALSPESSTLIKVNDFQYTRYNANYDYSTYPATFLSYTLGGSQSIEHSTINSQYQKDGVTTNVQDSYSWPGGGDPNAYAVYSGKDKRFTVNMNSIGVNFGIIYRLNLVSAF